MDREAGFNQTVGDFLSLALANHERSFTGSGGNQAEVGRSSGCDSWPQDGTPGPPSPSLSCVVSMPVPCSPLQVGTLNSRVGKECGAGVREDRLSIATDQDWLCLILRQPLLLLLGFSVCLQGHGLCTPVQTLWPGIKGVSPARVPRASCFGPLGYVVASPWASLCPSKWGS